MVKQTSMQWKRLRRYLTADPGQFAGGSAVSDPLGLLAIEREQLAEQHPGFAAGGPGGRPGYSTGATSRPRRDRG